MMSQRARFERFSVPGLLAVLAVIVCFPTATRGANEITGVVRNQSRGGPAAADDVILVRLDRGVQEEAHAKTDANGVFTFTVQHPDKPYLVRVMHQGVSYEQQASAGNALSIQVFDAARRVRGLSGRIEILRAGTNGDLLHVSDLIELKNESSPPLTQAGERTFEVYLPTNAQIDSVLAAGPGEIGGMISATPVAGEHGHYTVSFPIRPGTTKLAFNYDVPYDGRAIFHPKLAFSVKQLVVMIPPTMKFASRSPAFGIFATENSLYQVHTASEVKAGAGPAFEVSGIGVLPPLGDQSKTQARSPSAPVVSAALTASVRANSHSVDSIDSHLNQTQPSSQSLALVGVTSVLLAACALLVWRGRRARNPSVVQTVAPRVRPGSCAQPDRRL